MKEQILEAFTNLGFKLEDADGAGYVFDYEGTRASMRKDTMTRMNFFSRLSQMKEMECCSAEPMSKKIRLGKYGKLADEAFDEEESK